MTERATVLVTGGSGALGRRLVVALGAAGWRTRCLVHRRAVPEADEAVTGDIADLASLERAAAGVEAIVHLAGMTHARSAALYDSVNVEGTRHVLAAARSQAAPRIVHISTRAIALSGGAYSRSKLRAEELVRHSRLDHRILRLAEVYGAGGREGLDEIVARTRLGSPVLLVGRGEDQVCPVFVDDAIDAVTAALHEPRASGRTYTIAGEGTTVRDFAAECSRALGVRLRLVSVPAPAVRAAAALSRIVPLPLYPDQLARLRSPKDPVSPEAHADLGFAPRSLRDGLAALAVPTGGA